MGAAAMLLLMLGGLGVLVGLGGYLVVLQYRRQRPLREAEIALVPLDVLQRRARNYAIAASISLILYGLLKGLANSTFIAMQGIDGFGNIRGFISTTTSGHWFVFACTLGLASYLLATGILRLAGIRLALWFAAPAVAFDLLISFIIAMNRFESMSGTTGLIFVLAACSIPIIVTTLLVVALNTQLLSQLKAQMDERARRATIA